MTATPFLAPPAIQTGFGGSYYSGQHGALFIDGNKAAKVTNWRLEVAQPTLDTTTLGDTDATVTGGVRKHTGSAKIYYYRQHDGSNDASALLNRIIQARTAGNDPGIAQDSVPVQLSLRIRDGSTLGRYYTGTAWITSASMSMAVGEVLAADITFEFDGAPVSVSI